MVPQAYKPSRSQIKPANKEARPKSRKEKEPSLWQRIHRFFIETWEELKKVSWPTQEELYRMTGVVIVTVILLGIFLEIANILLSKLFSLVYVTGP
jgi:preprotein translocase SecE subunit